MPLATRQLRKSKKWVVLGQILDQWWIGPYDTRREADEARLGVQRFLAHYREKGYVSSCRVKEKPYEDLEY